MIYRIGQYHLFFKIEKKSTPRYKEKFNVNLVMKDIAKVIMLLHF